ncbi:MAG: hypothetical protein R3F43_18130 [bacterium]
MKGARPCEGWPWGPPAASSACAPTPCSPCGPWPGGEVGWGAPTSLAG